MVEKETEEFNDVYSACGLSRCRPFISIDELITEFEKRFNLKTPSYALPMIWVKHRLKNERLLITGYTNSEENGPIVKIGNGYYGLGILYLAYVFLDDSPCGVER